MRWRGFADGVSGWLVGGMQEHTMYVWNHFVKEAKASQVGIVAHSYGGVCTVHLMRDNRTSSRTAHRVVCMGGMCRVDC